MMRVKVEKIDEGLDPREIVVKVTTTRGSVSLVVDPATVHEDSTVTVGWPVAKEDDAYLVELPRETFDGTSRVWVSGDTLQT